MRRRSTSAFLRHSRTWLRSLLSIFDGPTLRGLAPLFVALALAPFLLPAIRSNLKEPLFSDTLVFQYTGWCLRHGLRLYRDFGSADGPFIHYLHAFIQALVGITDREFRKADVSIQALGSATVGALLAPAPGPRRVGRWLNRAAWASAAASIWLSWYFTFGWEGTTQREGFYSVFAAVGMALLFVSDDLEPRRATIALFVGAFLVTTEVFGKPTGLMYVAAGALGVAMPNAGATFDLRRRSKIFVAGSAACVLLVAAAFVVSGSFSGYFRWCFRTPYLGNRFLFGTDWHRLFLTTYWDRFSRLAAGAFVAGGASLGVGLLPPRALGFVVLPPIAFLGACLQARGYDYQIIPTVASAYALFLLVLTRLWKRDDDAGRPGERGLVAALALTFAGYYAFSTLQEARPRWAGDPKAWDVPEHQSGDDFKKVGQWIKAHTQPDDMVFAYAAGNAHIVLFAAERRTASPYYHDVWLDSISLLPQSEVKPDAMQLAALEKLQGELRQAACEAVLRNKPAAMVFDSVERAYTTCPELRTRLATDFGADTVVGALHVYLRKPG